MAPSTFYKWRDRPPTPAQRRRAELDVEVKSRFDASDEHLRSLQQAGVATTD
ncbi:hypothetical protein [Candidatus Poriferisodalis sp.]|uniref:hypothetical protein n=1 Tax=Candidatus Poriferisodalis sp. TaxID=3101277 RepID=UPI003B52FDF9